MFINIVLQTAFGQLKQMTQWFPNTFFPYHGQLKQMTQWFPLPNRIEQKSVALRSLLNILPAFLLQATPCFVKTYGNVTCDCLKIYWYQT
jgi:hypothetical protein